MKRKIWLITKMLLGISSLLLIAAGACKKTPQLNDSFDPGILNTSALQLQLDNSTLTQLDQKEIESLLYMREEEKMARDVYLTLGKKWNTRIFDNIRSAEETHMNAVLLLLNKYQITDPVANHEIGVFTNQTLQAFYDQLVQAGNPSLLNAYKAGATIEDRDIHDLKDALTYISSSDIRMVYTNLSNASGNHLRAFYKNLLRLGGTYTPQYLNQSEFDTIIIG